MSTGTLLDLAPTETTATTAPRRWWRRRKRGETSATTLWLTGVAPVAIALLSLALSVYSIVEANRRPEDWLSVPDIVRADTDEVSWLYVQPRLVSAATNDRVAVITGLRVGCLRRATRRASRFVGPSWGRGRTATPPRS